MKKVVPLALCLSMALWAAPASAADTAPDLRLVSDFAAPDLVFLPDLNLGVLDSGGGASVAGTVAPVLAFILGIFPGFGVGHLVAQDSSGFVGWLIADILIAVGFTLGETLLWGPSGLQLIRLLAVGAVIALRIAEGLSAMQAASNEYGRFIDPERGDRGLASVPSLRPGPRAAAEVLRVAF